MLDPDNLMIFESDEFSCFSTHRIDITREKNCLIRDPKDHGRSELRRYHRIGRLCIDDHESISPDDRLSHLHDSRHEIGLIEIFEELRDDLGVCIRVKVISLRLQLSLQIDIVLDDSIVYDEESSIRRGVWMTIRLGDSSMSRPSRMSDPSRIEEILCFIMFDLEGEVADLSDCLLEK